MELNLDLTKEQDVVALMASSKSLIEWNQNCDKVKIANPPNAGQYTDYPNWWYKAIILSGVNAQTRANW